MNRKKYSAGLFAVTGALLLISSASPVKADGSAAPAAGELKVYEISMNDTNPLETLKEDIIESRASYDAAVNLSFVNMDASSIAVDSFDRTKTGIQNINANIVVSMSDEKSSSDYIFAETAAIRMMEPEGPQVVLKSDEVTIDVGNAFSYSDNIGYVSSKDGNLPVIKEYDNVDVSQEGLYTCTIDFIDTNGKKTTVSYHVNVKKPSEVVRAEEAATSAVLEARRKAAMSTGGVIRVDDSALATEAGSLDLTAAPAGFSVSHASGDAGCSYERPQCTWWAYTRRKQLGLPVGTKFGNGNMWADSARKLGYWVDNTPRMVGDIMVFQGGQAGSSYQYGHVAIVEEIYPDGSVRVSEMGTGFVGYFCSNRVIYNTSDYEYIHI